MRNYRASSLGACMTRLVHEQLGSTALDPPATLQAAFDRGNTHEDACVAEMRAQGWEVWGEQDEVGLGAHPEDWVLTGHLDGLCRQQGDPWDRLLEVKAPNAWAKFERAYKTGNWDSPLVSMYAWQISVYMVCTGLEAVVACITDENILMPDQPGTLLRWFVIETPPHSREEIIERVTQINDLAEANFIPKECEGSLRDDWSCPYRHLHGAPERPVTVNLEVSRLGALIAAEQALEKAAKARIAAYKAELDEVLGLDDSIETADFIATRVTTTRTTYDHKRMEQDGIDLIGYAKPSVSTSIRVTAKGTETVDPSVPEI